MSENSILKCLIVFILGFLVARMIRGNGFAIGGQGTRPSVQCMDEMIAVLGNPDDATKCLSDLGIMDKRIAIEKAGCQDEDIKDYCNRNKKCKSNDGLLRDKVKKNLCQRAVLTNVDLSGADLKHSDLTDTILRNSNLSKSQLCSVNFERADLDRVDISNSNVTNAIFLDANNENFSNTDGTVWFDGNPDRCLLPG